MIRVKKIEMGGNAPCRACRVDANTRKQKFIHVVEVLISRSPSRFEDEYLLCLRCAKSLRQKLEAILPARK